MTNTSALQLSNKQQQLVHQLLKRYLADTTVWLYGSRIKGTARAASDLDMVVFTNPTQRNQVALLREAFDESNLPFRVDLFVWDDIPDSFKTGITAEHVVFNTP